MSSFLTIDNNFNKAHSLLPYQFKDESLLKQAVTRKTAVVEHMASCDNQRLEHLGDRVLGLAIAHILYTSPHPETELTRELNRITNNTKPLMLIAQKYGLDKMMIIGISDEKNNVRNNIKAMSDCTEALIGAIWLDCDDYDTFVAIVLELYQSIGYFYSKPKVYHGPILYLWHPFFIVIQYRFNDLHLMQTALTRKSATVRTATKEHNNRLKFLGSRVITTERAIHYFAKFPDCDEGDLTIMESDTTNMKQVVQYAKILELHKYIVCELDIERTSERTLYETFLAVQGAIFLDCGCDMNIVSSVLCNIYEKYHVSSNL